MMNIINDALCRIMTLYDAIMAISLREAANEAVARLGYDRGMKEEQLEITTKFLSGRDVFAILPTGFGKSLCYAFLPLAFFLFFFPQCVYVNGLLRKQQPPPSLPFQNITATTTALLFGSHIANYTRKMT